MKDEEILQCLQDVVDPEYPISIVEMGMVKGVSCQEGTVTVQLTFTSTGCPCMDWIIDDIKQRLIKEPGVHKVEVDVVWSKPWTARDLSPKAREIMKQFHTTA
jgi:metal-sulfur cluster biosynthetic enzyme